MSSDLDAKVYSAGRMAPSEVDAILRAQVQRQGVLEKKVHNKHWRKRLVRLQQSYLVEFDVTDIKKLTPDTAPVDIVAIQSRAVLCNVAKNKFILQHTANGHKVCQLLCACLCGWGLLCVLWLLTPTLFPLQVQDAYKTDSEETMQAWIDAICALQHRDSSSE